MKACLFVCCVFLLSTIPPAAGLLAGWLVVVVQTFIPQRLACWRFNVPTSGPKWPWWLVPALLLLLLLCLIIAFVIVVVSFKRRYGCGCGFNGLGRRRGLDDPIHLFKLFTCVWSFGSEAWSSRIRVPLGQCTNHARKAKPSAETLGGGYRRRGGPYTWLAGGQAEAGFSCNPYRRIQTVHQPHGLSDGKRLQLRIVVVVVVSTVYSIR